VSNNIPNFFEDDRDLEIEYLRINIEDNSEVPIILSFPVAYNFLENAFNESKLLRRDNSKRHNALVDSCIRSDCDIKKLKKIKLSSAALLSAI